ncbi:hypothetical protein CBR_g30278 [Chara braunii]|uniref:Uncharacterized protein n=1 Tax=Chara braunii TaxID=69332 RepID=A0A388LCG2_CHABU|nr:hypothetical protein CBR_g30278 [Chara braunii]|eukprot:GBG80017.1 hypothetical protein CBR_g30278 [Chara braunii]
MLEVGLDGGAKDEDVIKVHDDTDFEEVTGDVIHGGLECGGGIGESERHYEELIVPEPRAECGLMDVLLADTDLVEATGKVNLGEIFGSTKSFSRSSLSCRFISSVSWTESWYGGRHGGECPGSKSMVWDTPRSGGNPAGRDLGKTSLNSSRIEVGISLTRNDGGILPSLGLMVARVLKSRVGEVEQGVVVLGEGGGGATMVEVVVDEGGGVQVDGVGVEVEAEACPEEGVGWGVEEGGVVVVTTVMPGEFPSRVVKRSEMADMVVLMLVREDLRAVNVWTLEDRCEFRGGGRSWLIACEFAGNVVDGVGTKIRDVDGRLGHGGGRGGG